MELVVEPVEQCNAVARLHQGARCTRVRSLNISVFERNAFHPRTRLAQFDSRGKFDRRGRSSSEARISGTIPPKDNACASFTRESRYPEGVQRRAQLRIETPLFRRAGLPRWDKNLVQRGATRVPYGTGRRGGPEVQTSSLSGD